MIPQQILDAVERFEGPSPALPRLLTLVQDPDSTIKKLGQVLKLDPRLSGTILRLANSAYYGQAGRVSTIQRALMVLGRSELTRMVLAQASSSLRVQHLPGYCLLDYGLWHKSVRTAVGAELVAHRAKLDAPPLAYAVGLLADLGKLPLSAFVADELDVVVPLALKTLSFDQAEREVLGTDHAEVSAAIAESWGLPAVMVESIRYHHRPSDAEDAAQPLADCVHVADALSLMAGDAVGVDQMNYHFDKTALSRLSLSEEDIQEIFLAVDEGIAEANRLLAEGE